MRRRGLLLGGAATGVAAVAAVGWPGWLRKAFVEGRPGAAQIEPEGATQGAMRRTSTEIQGPPAPGIKGAIAQAKEAGKPVLVLVIPGLEARYDRGHAFGELLNQGSDAALAPLASAVVLCASTADLDREAGVSLKGEPLMVVLKHGAFGLDATPLDGALPRLQYLYPDPGDKAANKTIDERIALLEGLIARGLGAARGDVATLARQVRESIVKKPPRGGQWASASGCGTGYEEGPEKSEAVDCGMGHVPERSRRFLHFLTAKKS